MQGEARLHDKESDEYRRLEVFDRSLKMQLVSPYGYMQFALNNFRGVDANRPVPAFGRWYLLRARGIAEEAGFTVIYADTDSPFVRRDGATDADYRRFCETLGSGLGMELKLEYLCRWVLLLPERPGGHKGLTKKYLASVDGKVLARGLEVRRQDRSMITREVQENALEMLASARDAGEFRAMLPRVVSYAGGRVSADELAIIKKLSRRPEEYNPLTHHCVAA